MGDPSAEIVPRLIAYLVCQGVSMIDAADCVQETLIDALPPVCATREHPYAWCRRVEHLESNHEFLRCRPGADRQSALAVSTRADAVRRGVRMPRDERRAQLLAAANDVFVLTDTTLPS
jgi:DNA-directed RNA polymerase specialized sigma24 family protein